MKKNRSDVAFADAEEQASSDRHQSRIPSGQGVRSIEKMDDLEPAERDAIREELCEHASDFPEEHIFKNTPALVAGSQASEAIDDATPQYEETEAGIFLIKQTSSGPERKQLTNFIPHISTEIVLDNGIEKQRQYEITVTLRGKTYQFVLSVEQFSAMNWPAKHLGVQAVVYAGAGTRDHARAAIQTLSHDVKRHTVYTYTGWREIDGRRVFLHGGGAIGRDGPVEGVEVDLPDELAAYVLPVVQDHDALIRSVLASLEIRKVAPEQITMPLLAAVHRSVLDHPCDASVFLVGPTGVGKSELAALANQHFGPGLDRVNLPANWSSTANALEAIPLAAKNVMLTIDDFAPSGSSGHVSELHQKADRVLRAQGNGAGRQRMGSDLKLKPTMSPGGVILATGEVLLRCESLRARMLVVTISPGDVDHKKLTQCQEDGREGAYATAMAGFAQYLAGDGQQAMATLDKRLATYREKAGSAHAHARTASIVANLYVGWELFTEFAQSIGAITEDERRDLLDSGWSAITRCAEKQSAFQQTQEPAHQFIRLIKNAITSGRLTWRAWPKECRPKRTPGAGGRHPRECVR